MDKGDSGHGILGNKSKTRNEWNIFTVGIELLSSVQNKTVADPKWDSYAYVAAGGLV